MKVPKYIQAKMHRLARLSSETAQLSQSIDEYFSIRGYNVDFCSKKSLRSGDGVGLEELELGNDITKQFVERFERGEYDLYSPCLIGDTVYFIAEVIDTWKIVQGKVIKLKTNEYVPFDIVYFCYEDFGIRFFTAYEDAKKDLEAIIKAEKAFKKKIS